MIVFTQIKYLFQDIEREIKMSTFIDFLALLHFCNIFQDTIILKILFLDRGTGGGGVGGQTDYDTHLTFW
jgi:hypothetical protein